MWYASNEPGSRVVCIVPHDDDEGKAWFVNTDEPDRGDTEQDAKLLATARDMRDALIAMLDASDALAHATPGALEGVPNARELHLVDVAARRMGLEALERAGCQK